MLEKQDVFRGLKRKVIYCLETFPHTREDDIQLYLAVIWHIAPNEIIKIKDRDFVSTDAIKLVSSDGVTRIRRQLNEKGLFLPTDPEVRKARHINEEQWRKFLGYSTSIRSGVEIKNLILEQERGEL
jgi:hypothetical protein